MRTLKIDFPDIGSYEKTRLIPVPTAQEQLTTNPGDTSIYVRNAIGYNPYDWAILDAFESEDAEIVQVQSADRESHIVDLLTPIYQEHALGGPGQTGAIFMKTPYNMVKIYRGLMSDMSDHGILAVVNLRPDMTYTYYDDPTGQAAHYYSYKFYNSYGESIVIGTDGLNYRCILSHTSDTATNKPVTGSSWATYWAVCSTTGVAWVNTAPYVTGVTGEQTFYSTSFGESVVVGSDGLNYRCIQAHIASLNNKPVTGSYSGYWTLCASGGSTWVAGSSYITGSDYDAVLTVADLKNHFMFGLDLTDDDGTPFPNSMFEFAIKAAVDSLEKTLGIKIKPTFIVDEYQDYFRQDYLDFAFIQLNNYPIISVSEVKMKYPTAQSAITFPSEWYQWNTAHGQVHLIPTSGSLSQILMGQGGDYLTFVWKGWDWMPNLWRITYTAGFARGQVPNDVLGVIGKMACFYPLNIAGDLVGGIAIASKSIGIDGLSQSINTTSSPENAGYSARLREYERELKIEIPRLQAFYKGVRMAVA